MRVQCPSKLLLRPIKSCKILIGYVEISNIGLFAGFTSYQSGLRRTDSTLKTRIPDVLASGILFFKKGSCKVVPEIISSSNLEFDAAIRDDLTWNDAHNLASFLGQQLRNLHSLPYPQVKRPELLNANDGHEELNIPPEWKVFVDVLRQRKKDVTGRLENWYPLLKVFFTYPHNSGKSYSSGSDEQDRRIHSLVDLLHVFKGVSRLSGGQSPGTGFGLTNPAQGSTPAFNMGGNFNKNQSHLPCLAIWTSSLSVQNTNPAFPQPNNFSTPSTGFENMYVFKLSILNYKQLSLWTSKGIDEENSNTPKADTLFIPRENPRALFEHRQRINRPRCRRMASMRDGCSLQLDLETLVQFNTREVIVFMDESRKPPPPVGEALNKPCGSNFAEYKMYGQEKQVTEGLRLDKYKEMLKRKAEEQGAQFRVKHFVSFQFVLPVTRMNGEESRGTSIELGQV
ncbi:unnamed protein product [Arabis nemorensis]|uniref:Peptidase S59 domain-containing protein n=1 Tax=Arabis nemorensis TaxID=586526 RepID=A0A565BZW6_9BRAS|nr:unnamed protein product [Arabis nemorensis]